MNADNRIFFALVEEQLAECPRVKITLKGTSMLPTLLPGDTLTLVRPATAPAVGDVVLFRCGDGHLLHRVVWCDGERYRMQGDHSYTCEEVCRQDIVAVLEAVGREGRADECAGATWRRQCRRALRRSAARRRAYRWMGRDGRRRLRPWYFGLLAFLMWAPLNGLGIPLDNYILGLRADHLLHASVYLPCVLFLMDLFGGRKATREGRRTKSGGGRGWAWLCAVAIGLFTEGVQYLLPYRGFDVNDLIANTLGVILGWLAVWVVYRTASRSAGSQ